jgi:hypothetical protein
VARPWERMFLGFSFTSGTMPKRRIAAKALTRFTARIRILTRRTRGISLATMVRELDRYLQGWQGYFGFCQTPSVLNRLNQWIRRRLRSAAWKQWRSGRKRYAHLRKLGLSHDLAARTAGYQQARGGLAARKLSPTPCRPLTLIAWGCSIQPARPETNPSEPPCTDQHRHPVCRGVVRNMVATSDGRLYLACSGVNKVAIAEIR